LGIAFLVAVFASKPMFKSGAMDVTLRTYFTDYIEENNKYPTIIGRKDAVSADYEEGIDKILTSLNGYEETWKKYLNRQRVISSQTVISTGQFSVKTSYEDKSMFLRLNYMDDLDSHSSVAGGEEKQGMLDGAYPVLISERTMDYNKLVLGEKIYVNDLLDSSGEKLTLYVAGVIKESDVTDLYWCNTLYDYDRDVFLDKDSFNEIIKNYSVASVSYVHNVVLDYHSINSQNIADVRYYIEEFVKKDECFTYSFENILTDYFEMDRKVDTLIYVMALPILMLTLAFIYMVSGKIIESETEEIAMLRSRGLSRFEIIKMYILESLILGVIGYAIGIPLGMLLCFIAGNTTDFLTYEREYIIAYAFNPLMLMYGIVAVAIATLFIVLPIIPYSDLTVASRVNKYEAKSKTFWEKYYLDIVLLIISVYLLINYNRQVDSIRISTMFDGKLDPVIFIDVILFIISAGMLSLRVLQLLVRFIYKVGKKRWKLNTYTAFLQITRTFSKQVFISLFLILTIAMGVFDSSQARTISKNHQERIAYENGADVRFSEKWSKKTMISKENGNEYEYVEPDYGKYSIVLSDICESYTRVIERDNLIAKKNQTSIDNCKIIGINTKEFGETAALSDEFNMDTHWYSYLNTLSQKPEGIIISKNLAEALGVNKGEMIQVVLKNEDPADVSKNRGVLSGNICEIVDDWPGYDKYYYEDGKEKENYLIIANYSMVIEKFRMLPYSIWARLKAGHTVEELKSKLSEAGIISYQFASTYEEILKVKNSPFVQTTNGMFTLGFIVTLLLCMVGFLIYWIVSIGKRELQFGIYRAMGMSLKEINGMLILEHVFSTLFSIILGIGVGALAMVLFSKLYSLVYLPEKHNVSMVLEWQPGDMLKLLAIVGILLVVCAMIIRRKIKSLNITKALKLGEE